MTRRQLWVCALACGCAAGIWQSSFAQQPKAAGNAATKPTRPPAETLRIERPVVQPPLAPVALSPELEALLVQWERSSAKIKTMTGKHTRSEYNSVFEVEKRSEGKFFFEAPDKGRIDMAGIAPEKGAQSARNGEGGKPYRLQAGTSERWICTGAEVLQINDQEKQFEAIVLPPEMRGDNILRSPLPFLFGLKAAEAKKRFQFKMMKGTNDYYALEVVPLTPQDAFRKAYVKLDKKTFVPTAVILFDNADSLEQRYEFTDIKINDGSFKLAIKAIFGVDPFRPNLANYKRVQPPAAVQPAGREQPAGQKPVVQPVGGAVQGSQPGVSKVTRPPTAPPKSAGKN